MEKKYYWDNAIRPPKPEPTLLEEIDLPVDGVDSTDTLVAGRKTTTASPYTPIMKVSALGKFLRDKSAELIIVSIFLPVFLWMAYQVYALNREVGELRSKIDNIQSLDTKLDKLGDRIDKLFEQQYSINPGSKH